MQQQTIRRRWPIIRRFLALVAGAVVATSSVACSTPAHQAEGASEVPSSVPSQPFARMPQRDPALAELLPPGINALRLATDAETPVTSFRSADGETNLGFEIDLVRAIAAQLGLPVQVSTSAFDGIITSLQARRFDMAVAAMDITPTRLEQIDQIPLYRNDRVAISRSDSPIEVNGMTDLCGVTVGVVAGASYYADLLDADKDCREMGSPPITIRVYPANAYLFSALDAGRTQVQVTDWTTATYLIDLTPGKWKIVGSIGDRLAGIAMTKSSPLSEVIRLCVDKLIESGLYTEIMTYWGAETAAIGRDDLEKK